MEQLQRLEAWFRRHAGVQVAYSGGVDSGLLAVAAHRALGDRALAVLALGESLAEHDRAVAERFAAEQGFRFRAVGHTELAAPGFRANAGDRCYHCRASLAATLCRVAEAEGLTVIVDGFNADDTSDYRPGRRAADEAGFLHPLFELGFGKRAIRATAAALGLSLAQRPSNACLASRIPAGVAVTDKRLRRIERAEAAVRALGFDGHRVRDHGEVARLELPAAALERGFAERAALTEALKRAGFRYTTLDLEGYRTGSLNP